MLRGRRTTAPRRSLARAAGAVLTPAAVLAAAGLAHGQTHYGQTRYGQPFYGQPEDSQPQTGGFFGPQADDPPPAPAPADPQGMNAARREAARQQRAFRQSETARRQATRERAAALAPHFAAETAGPARVSVLGAVKMPRTFEFERAAPDLAELLERAGGLTGASDRTVRVIRGGRPAAQVRFSPGMVFPLAAGDVVVADAVPGTGPREPGVSHVALVGLTDRPVVLAVEVANANVPELLASLGQPAETAASVMVMNTTGAKRPLPDGSVLVFPPGTAAEQNWGDFGDLVKEAPEPAPTVADMAPVGVPERAPKAVAAAPILTPGRRASARPAAGPPAPVPAPVPTSTAPAPAALAPAAPVASGSSETLSLPALPSPTASVDPIPAPRATPRAVPAAPEREETETLVVDLLDAPPAGGPNADLYDDFGDFGGDAGFGAGGRDSDGLALLPAPSESPFYADDAALAANGSHLIPLPDDAPPAPPALAPPGGMNPRLRVAVRPTPGVMTDSPRGGALLPPAPRTLRESGRPIPAETAPLRGGPVPPAADLSPAEEIPAESPKESVKAGVPWVTIGFVFGALIGGIAAAGVALRRRTAALVTSSRTRTAAKPRRPVAAPSVAESRLAAAAASEAAVKAAAARTAAADRKVLDDLIADRLPLSEEAVALPEAVAVHGKTAGMSKLRLDPAQAGLAGPHFAVDPAGAASGAAAATSRRAGTVSA